MAHGHFRLTDIREILLILIFYDATKANIKRLVKALKEVGYDGVEDLTVEQLQKKKTLFRQYILDTDVHPFVAGVEFKDVWKTRKEVEIEKVKVFVPSLENIILIHFIITSFSKVNGCPSMAIKKAEWRE